MPSWVQPYGLFQAAAVLVCVLLTHRALVRRGSGVLERPELILTVLIGAGLGGRLHVLLEGILFRGMGWNEVRPLLHPLTGGSAFFGAACGVLLVLILWGRRLPTGGLGGLSDAAVVGAGWGILIGRIGCLRQGCCLGNPIEVPNAIGSALQGLLPKWPGLWACQPLPLWLGLWGLASAYLSGRVRRTAPPGTRFLYFVGLFSLGRFFLEFMRWDPGWRFPIRVAQFESLGLLLIVAAILHRRAQTQTQTQPATRRVASRPSPS